MRHVVAGLCGGLAEIVWVAAYASVTGGSSAEIARQITLSLLPGIAGAPQAAGFGIAIHLTLSVLLALAYVAVAGSFVRRLRPVAAVAIASAALACVWAFNFFVLLPALNPAFVELLPYPVSLASKLLFGIAMACVLLRGGRLPLWRKAGPRVFLAAALYGATTLANAQVVTAVKAPSAPKLAALAKDPAWARAKVATVKLADGENFKDGATSVALKALYTGDTLYLLIQYADSTRSYRRSPYVKQADGSWKKLTDPDDRGGDNNKYYEDKLAMIWNVGNSIKDFQTRGCEAACHAGEKGKPFGNKYTRNEGELGDIWHLKSVRTGAIGQVDDQYVDNTRFDKDKSPDAGRKSDPNTGGGYNDIKLVGDKPEFMSKSAKPANAGGTYWLLESEKMPFDDSKFKAGDEVASIMIAPFTGDRGDISSASDWSDGTWTIAISRKLKTGGKFDVQFDDLRATYYFGVAAFDNAQVRHAVHQGALQLKFAK